MLRKFINKYYFESDIFNVHQIDKPTPTISIKDNRKLKKNQNAGSVSCDNISPINITQIGTIDNTPVKPRKIFFKAEQKGIPKEIQSMMNSEPSSIPWYNPNDYYKQSDFVKEQDLRKKNRKMNVPSKEKESYDENTVNYRKYGSSFDPVKPKDAISKKSKGMSMSMDSGTRTISVDNKTAKEKKLILQQSNIFHSAAKEKENENELKKIAKEQEEIKANIKNSTYRKIMRKKEGDKEDNSNLSISINDNKTKHRRGLITQRQTSQRKVLNIFNNNNEDDDNHKEEDNNPSKYHKKSNEYKMRKEGELSAKEKTYLNKFINNKITNGVIYQYQINHNTNGNQVIDMIEIKKQFRSKGIEIFGEEYHDTLAFTKSRCFFKIRENENDKEQCKKIENIINEIEDSNKLSFKKVQTQPKKQGLKKTLNDSIQCKSIKPLPTPKTPNVSQKKNIPKLAPVRQNKHSNQSHNLSKSVPKSSKSVTHSTTHNNSSNNTFQKK